MTISALNINCNIGDLIRPIVGANQRFSYNSRYFDAGRGRFVSIQCNGIFISACYHSTKHHTATAQVCFPFGGVARQSKSDAPPGKWAIASQGSQWLCIDKTFYDTA